MPWLLASLNSSIIWEWLVIMGDQKRNGWRGIDKTALEDIPVPKHDRAGLRRAAAVDLAAGHPRRPLASVHDLPHTVAQEGR